MSAPGEVRYARSGETDIAFATIGEGPDIVMVPGFVSHLDLMWDVPALGGFCRRLTQFARVTVFDKRGTGLSSRSLGFGSLAERADDIRAVMDAAELDEAHLVAVSEGGPLAVLFAASHPERVNSLSLYGTFARLNWAPDYQIGIDPEVSEGFVEWVRANWGTGRPMTAFIQDTPDTEETLRLLARFERSACSPAQAAAILRNNASMDVRSLLSTVAAPTLVTHSAGDPLIPAGLARYLAEAIPAAVHLERPGVRHMCWSVADLAWVIEAIAEFVGAEGAPRGKPQGAAPARDRRTFATVLLTDICGSTARAAQRGDRAWKEALDQHDAITRQEVDRHSGRFVKATGDGALAVFRTPSEAVGCAHDLVGRLEALDLPIRAGVHAGEIELRGDDIGGVAVNIASRVSGLAGESEVLVSRTVRDLMTGSGTDFEPRGSHKLKGLEEEWDLYAAPR